MQQLLADKPWILVLIFLWSLPWKGVALWISARRNHIGWFVVLLILNTLGILDMLYIFIFSKWDQIKSQEVPSDKEQKMTNPGIKTMIA